MKHTSTLAQKLSATALLAILAGSLLSPASSFAKGGATDPIPGTSKSGLSTGGGGGGGGKKSTTPAPAPAPTPAPQPIVVAPLLFSTPASIDSVTPICTGSYRIDPYYPTLSLMTVDVQASSVNVPDGTPLYITVNGLGGTLYPFTSNVISILSQSGTCSHSVYITPGTTVTSFVITDGAGNVISTGK